jgi:hypothetical protein
MSGGTPGRWTVISQAAACRAIGAADDVQEIYAIFRTGQSQALLARIRTWITALTDQAIIAGEPDPRVLADRIQHLHRFYLKPLARPR